MPRYLLRVLQLWMLGSLLLMNLEAVPWTQWRTTAGALGTSRALTGIASDGQKIRMVDFENLYSADLEGRSLRQVVSLSGLRDIAYHEGLWVAVGNAGLLYTSPDGDTWTPRSSGTPDTLTLVEKGGGAWIACEEGSGFYLLSSDGINWERRSFGNGFSPSSLAWAGGYWIGGSFSGIIRSTDGVNWTPATGGAASSVVWTGSRWLAVYATKVYTSPDGLVWGEEQGVSVSGTTFASAGGVTVVAGPQGIQRSVAVGVWTEVPTPADIWIQKVRWTGSVFLATGGGVVMASPDGLTWELVRAAPSGAFSAAAAGPTRTLISGVTGGMFASADGVDWKALSRIPSLSFHDMVWSGGEFLAIGPEQVASSSDGQAWNFIYPPVQSPLRAMTSNGQVTVAVGWDGAIIRKAGAAGWTVSTSPTSNNLMDVEYGGGWFLAVSSTGETLRSSDAAAWEIVGTTVPLKTLSRTPTHFVAISQENKVLQTVDGASWSIVWDGGQENLTALAGNAARLVVAGDQHLYSRGADGVWEIIPVRQYLVKILADRNGFVGVGNGGYMIQSPDGRNWTPRLAFEDTAPWRTAWGNGRFVRVNGQTSADGDTWTSHPFPAKESFEDICYSGNGFAAVGRRLACVSVDGIEWQATALPGIEYLTRVTPFQGGYVATGTSGTAARYTPATGWVQVPATGLNSLGSIVALAASPSLIVCADSTNQIRTSSDGVTWTLRAVSGSRVIWDGARFIVSGYSGIHTSTDGVNWETHNTPSYIAGEWLGLFDGYYVVAQSTTVAIGSPENGWTTVRTFGNPLNAAFDGTRLILGNKISGGAPRKSFARWAADAGIAASDAGFAADQNGDGIPNGIAYIRGLANGRANGSESFNPRIGPGQTIGSSRITFSESWPLQGDFDQSVWYSRDLNSDWVKIAESSSYGWSSLLPEVQVSASGEENRRNLTIEIRSPGESPHGFFRFSARLRGQN